ncbi:NlpC/P60 family protein [Actinoplanes sp. NPDC023936]|uniref:C40 family peptidase n=1 Tax=Actinoplanes sp. NPDC023936 TaxID=3154910 RepID=UPI0033CFF875
MSKALRYGSTRRSRFVPSRLRPFALPAAVLAAIATLFQPIPAMAAPIDPAVPAATTPATSSATTSTSIPNSGARPTQTGALVLPGSQTSTTTTTTAALPVTSITGTATSPIVQQVEKGRAEIAALGDQLIRVGQDRDIMKAQVATAAQKVLEAQESLRAAQTNAVEAADAAVREAAALPPGTAGSGLLDLESLARLQRGEATAHEAAARRLESAQTAAQLTLDEQTTSTEKFAQLAAEWTKLSGQLTKKQAAQQKLETANAAELNAAETTQTATDQALGSQYLTGAEAGRGADARAIKALEFALAQRGDPYVWSEEGPDQYDCSGLMYAAYRQPSVGYPLTRVSRDQYYQTRDRAVSRYSLLPGDLLFFSSSNSWTGIHHVAMYAGEGMMVEAPRTGLNVRLTPVRWSRLFAATRVFGSIEGDVETPDLGAPDPDEPVTGNPTTPGSPSRTPAPSTSATPGKTTSPTNPSTPPKNPSTPPKNPSTPPSKPSTEPSKPSTEPSKPSTEPSKPSTEPSKPSTEPSTEPSKPSTEPSEPVTEPTTTKPETQPAPEETTSSPATGAPATETTTTSKAADTTSSSAAADTESVSPSKGSSSAAD